LRTGGGANARDAEVWGGVKWFVGGAIEIARVEHEGQLKDAKIGQDERHDGQAP
jgi:hypothetical protein